ncbi:MAG: DUF4837 family protein [Rhodothermales bacterium]
MTTTPFLRKLPQLIFLLAVAAISGCSGGDRRPPATGKEGVITVVMSNPAWGGPVGDAVRAELGKPIQTLPLPEPAFDLEQYDLTTSDLFRKVIKKRKYILFAASLDEESNVAKYIRSGINDSTLAHIRAGESGIMKRPNAWYRKQLVVYAIAPTQEDLIKQITERGEDLRYVFNESTRERLTDRMFERMEQTDLEDTLMDHHDFTVNVQHDYFIAQDTLNFVRLRRVLSDTWRDMFIYYIENANPNLITEDWILATRDSLTEKLVRGSWDSSYVEIDRRRPITSENINFLGRYGFETRALWHMTKDAMGGPVLNYTFYDEKQRRIYMIDGMVFAPNFDKREFLRQVEVVAYTFRTRQDEEMAGTDKSEKGKKS